MIQEPQAPSAKSIFLAAIEGHQPDEWPAFVEAACAGDPQLLASVEKLLRSHRALGTFHESPAADETTESADAAIGTQIGAYKLLEQIGEGGMGLVYMAEQQRPVRRLVALKIIKPGLDSRQIIARFEAERQALAMMDHPNIAKVFEAGTAETGRPYFVMELVRGIPITEFCDHKKLNIRQRLELFIQVCQAVQHAHQKGIIHRDLKPTNVLVTMHDALAVPKIIDFGIAKALGQSLTENTLHTGFAQLIGTPLYMSPEQADMNAFGVDTRSDVYSLGVMLYELLTGTTPFDKDRLKSAGFDEIRRIIREEEAETVSRRLAKTKGTAQRTGTNPKSEIPNPKCSTELDWIVGRCLEKDRNRRYESPSALAADIERYLADEPVLACPPSRGYRLRKLANKHRKGLTIVALFSASLVLGAALSLWQAIRATSAQRVATANETRAVAAERAALMAAARESNARRAESTERAKAKASEQEARSAAALAQNEAIRANAEAQRANEEARLARSVNAFLNVDILAQSSDRSITLKTILDRAAQRVEARFRNYPKAEALVRHTIGSAYHRLAEYAAAEPQLKRSLELAREAFGAEAPETKMALNQLAILHLDQGRREEAAPLLEFVVAQNQKAYGDDDPRTLGPMNNLGTLFVDLNRDDKAEPHFLKAYETMRRVAGDDDPRTLTAANNLANLYRRTQRYADAEPLLKSVLAATIRTRRENDVSALDVRSNLAALHLDLGRYRQAEVLYRKNLAVCQQKLTPKHPQTLGVKGNLGSLYLLECRFAEAEPLYREVLEVRRAASGEESESTLIAENNLGALYRFQGNYAEALALLSPTLEASRRVLGPAHPCTLGASRNLAQLYLAQDRLAEAESLLSEALKESEKQFGAEHSQTLGVRGNLARLYGQTGEFEQAETIYRRILAYRQSKLPAGHPETLNTLESFVANLVAQQKWNDAEPLAREALAATAQFQPALWLHFRCQALLGAVLVAQAAESKCPDSDAATEKLAEAEQLLLAGFAGLQKRAANMPADRKANLTEAGERLIELYTLWNKPDEAARWKRELAPLETNNPS